MIMIKKLIVIVIEKLVAICDEFSLFLIYKQLAL